MAPRRNHTRMFRRFVTEGDSMLPGLRDGDGLIAVRLGRARVGQRRVVEHPWRPGVWLVKRVDEVAADGTMRVLSDNRAATRADSRTFGSLPVEGTYLVVARIPRRWLGRDTAD